MSLNSSLALPTLFPNTSLLVYSRTEGYRHDSIPVAQDSLRTLGYNATFTEDAELFSNLAALETYSAIVFLSTTSDVLYTDLQRHNFEQYLVNGGGLVGIHSATDTLQSSPCYGAAIGARFQRHPEFQNATFRVLNSSHPSTEELPELWRFPDEVYSFQSDPRSTNVSLLLTVDDESYFDNFKQGPGGAQGDPHPIAWHREGGAIPGQSLTITNVPNANGSWGAPPAFQMPGRMWYTSLGHGSDIWGDPIFQSHIRGGIDWVLANGTMPERPAAPVDNSTLAATPARDGTTITAMPTSAGVASSARSSLAGLLVLALAGSALLL